ncbi:MAG TPA: hypothetical protein VMG59_01550 [Phycisphaerae bacterium]|nr:hypothetical protein [Phycisphaerae bacterium]
MSLAVHFFIFKAFLAAADSSSAPATVNTIHPAWFRYVLLVIVWMFVAAVLIGPIEHHFSQRRESSGPRPRAW